MNIIKMKVEDLIPYINNPRNNESAVDKVASSINEFGFKNPIIIDKNNIVINGHTRLLASKKLGLKEVPVIRADDLTEAQVKAFRIADNKTSEYATWNEDLLKLELEQLEEMDFNLEGLNIDYSEFDLEIELDDFEGEYNEENDIVEEPPKIPFSKQQDIWLLGKHRLMCGSSTENRDIEKLMNGEKAHLLITDPPYNVSYKGKTKDELTIKNDKMSDNNFYDFLCDFYRVAYENLIDGAGAYIFHADLEGVNFRKSFTESGFKLSQVCVWAKNTLVMGRNDYHWKHEPCLYGWKPTGSHRWFSDRKQTTVWEFDRPTRNAEHPTMKPVPLIQYCIENSSQVGELVLETFGGSGTTMIASDICGRRCNIIELDEKYVDVIVKRYINHKQNNGEDVYLLRDGNKIPYSEIEEEFNKEAK